MRTIFIGDLHGCIDEFRDLMQEISFCTTNDRLYSVGDVIGKGPNSLKVLQELKRLKACVVRGNHEEKLLRLVILPFDYLNKQEQKYLTDLGSELDFWIQEILTWPFYMEEKNFTMVHGGLEPFKETISQMSTEVVTHIRNWPMSDNVNNSLQLKPWYEYFDFSKTSFSKPIIFGHWAKKGLVNLPYVKGLDTGCVYGKRLTAYCLEENQFYFVKSRKAYCKL